MFFYKRIGKKLQCNNFKGFFVPKLFKLLKVKYRKQVVKKDSKWLMSINIIHTCLFSNFLSCHKITNPTTQCRKQIWWQQATLFAFDTQVEN